MIKKQNNVLKCKEKYIIEIDGCPSDYFISRKLEMEIEDYQFLAMQHGALIENHIIYFTNCDDAKNWLDWIESTFLLDKLLK